MKVLVVGDIHGRYEFVNQAFDKFLKERYDKIIFMGDICDSFDRSDRDIERCYNIIHAMMKTSQDKIVSLIGNHDEPYFNYNPEKTRCPGFRPSLHMNLHITLTENKKHHQYAYGIGDHLFTHAGVQLSWFGKHFDILKCWADIMQLDIQDAKSLWIILDSVARTSDANIFREKGAIRGGLSSDFGSPLWCDMSEMLSKGPYPGLHQVCGHTPTDNIYRFRNFGDSNLYKNTSVAYIDVLSSKPQFMTLYIDI